MWARRKRVFAHPTKTLRVFLWNCRQRENARDIAGDRFHRFRRDPEPFQRQAAAFAASDTTLSDRNSAT